MIETLANGYSYDSTQRELSNEYQHDRVSMVFKEIVTHISCLSSLSSSFFTSEESTSSASLSVS